MTRLALSLGLVLSLALLAASWPRAAELPAPVVVNAPSVIQPLGVASCAAMACHHGNGPPGTRGSEYSAWIAVDPHAKAYRVLFSPESRRMHEAMAKHDPAMANACGPQENPLCLRCHGMGDGVPASLQADGVGCERCHGPAEKWKTTHYLRNFDRTTSGFHDLRNNLTVRAEVCMGCHVGQGGMEVDHDLIAVGHPRLRFEYAGYFASYPKHWHDDDRAVHGDDVEARGWVLGELTSAKAALELLAARADDRRDSWPEFAEYDCAACHHQLQPDSPRLKRDLARANKGVKVRPGTLPWGTWYYPLLSALPGEPAALRDSLDRLGREMRKPLPPRGKVRNEALAAAKLLADWRKATCDQRLDAKNVRALMAAVAKQTDAVEAGWDGGTQVYLGLAALHQALGDLHADHDGLRGPLDRMRKDLLEAFPAGSRPVYDSPSRYRPAPLREALDIFRQRLK